MEGLLVRGVSGDIWGGLGGGLLRFSSARGGKGRGVSGILFRGCGVLEMLR